MHVVVPMSGLGQRFVEAGYAEPKPLIVVDGKRIIQHVVEMFPGESKFSFICNSRHLATTEMRSVLESIAPGCAIHEIPGHKLGPVYAVSRIFDAIDDEEEVIVNYCDFGKKWDYADFLRTVRERRADGALSAYRGFHPHMLHSPNYAFMRESGGLLLEIQEKKPFTGDRMSEYASDGTYYFRSGAILKRFFREAMDRRLETNGEFYVSVVYNLLVEAGMVVAVHEIEKMFQWGTPADLEEYLGWGELFRALASRGPVPGYDEAVLLVPMAGRGARFADAGFAMPKPLIEVDGRPMVVNAAKSLPPCGRQVFVALDEHLEHFPVAGALDREFPGCKIVGLRGVTEGQAITCRVGLAAEEGFRPLFVGASDNGMLYDHERLQALVRTGADVVAFGFMGGATGARRPAMYGWIDADGDGIRRVSVKVPVSEDPAKDWAVVGAFFFRTIDTFRRAVESLVSKNVRVNGEFYVDSLVNEIIEAGGSAKLLKVDHYLCWGTPDDLRTYRYWAEHFRHV